MAFCTNVLRQGVISLPIDSFDYDVITEGVTAVRGVPGLTCEIGLRRGGGSKFIVDALVASGQLDKTHIALDPYGDIDYEDSDEKVTKYDYSNEMRDECLVNLYAYCKEQKVNFVFFCLEDTEFFRRYSDGVPVYRGYKRMETQYAFVHFDGPHSVRAVLAEVAFFDPRAPLGAIFVFDDVDNYDHAQIDRLITEELGWKNLRRTGRKWSYLKSRVLR